MFQNPVLLPEAPWELKPPVRGLIPALFTRMCRPPISPIVRATALSTDSGSVTSAMMGSTALSPPSSRKSLAVWSSQSWFMSSIATRAPARTSPVVMERPMPMGLAAPVTMATLPSNVFDGVVMLYLSYLGLGGVFTTENTGCTENDGLLLPGSSGHPGAHIRQNGNQHTQHHHTANGNDGTESAPAKQEVARKTAV